MLYQHQLNGAQWLLERPRAYLGDEPGLGKTRTLLRALRSSGARRPLIVCPAIVRTHWHREGYDDAQEYGGEDLLVKSYDEIVRGGMKLMAELVLRERIDALVLDEAHYCKHASSQRSQLLLGAGGYARRIDRVWLASGTPIPKHAGELWTQLVNLRPDVLEAHGVRDHQRWIDRFCVMRGRFLHGQWIESPKPGVVKNEHELRAILDQVMLRRTLADVGLDVPALFWQVVRLDVGAAADWAAVLDAPTARVQLALQTGEALEDIANDPHVARMRRRLGELKVAPVAEMLTSQLADSADKVVVFAHHRTVLSALRELLRSFGVAYVDGDVSGAARDEAIDRFQTDPRTRVFLGQNLACQTGITLTAASRVVLVEPDWTADVNYQLGKRVARIGQGADHCIAQMIALAGTLDEAIVGQNLRETRMHEEILQ